MTRDRTPETATEGDEHETPSVIMRSMLRSVVKVMTTSDAPDYEQPWQTEGPDGAVGSGVIVMTSRGPRVLTNAHVVENQVFVEVRRYGKSRKFEAEVEGIGHVCDLALLKVKDPGFAEGAPAFPVGELPTLGDRVSVLGFPVGGDRLSITEGIVSRIEMYPYAHSQRSLLAVQIDAAINSGNSGGPVVKDGVIVGIAFEALDDAENVGFMIGAPVVRHFLRDIENGVQDGFPDLGIVTQELESKAHRRSLGLSPKSHSGVLVTGVVHGGSAYGVIEKGDVLLMLDQKNIAADGSIRFRKGERIDLSYQVARHHVGEIVPVKVYRDGVVRGLEVPMKPPRFLVAEDSYDVKPTYYLYGGLLFVPLSRDLLMTWGSEWWQDAPSEIVSTYENEIRTASRSEVVVLQKVLADRVNQGYHDFEAVIIERVQGRKIRDLKELVRIVESSTDEFTRFESHDGDMIVLERASVEKRNSKILRRYGVPVDRSQNLQK
ncbi:MAG: trypsin-like serine protease [Woeseia sp.]|nr:trypsin-like peptidase domain-containing protein [Woeseia sp.]MBT8096356.1 trypsin-like peptidase domain-containing protein [Woeseia sp.]NNE60067.1 trypsin-like serine protease [Woeseia sp.]NNL54982.1 trypsin-like serine protease [Woeseia sp.]